MSIDATLDQVEAYLTDDTRPRYRFDPKDGQYRWYIQQKA
jgi:hypothetical protein